MDMRCSVYLRPAAERQKYVDEMLASVADHFKITDKDEARFMSQPKIRELEKMLKSVTMPIQDAIDYLGSDFAKEWNIEALPIK